MIRLHLLGFTPDLKGLVFSGRRGGRAGTYWVAVDDSLAKALGQLEDARDEAEQNSRAASKQKAATKKGSRGKASPKGSSRRSARDLSVEHFLRGAKLSVTDTQDLPLPRTPPRPQSKLSPREIQQMLREGRTVRDVAGAAGVEIEWVERFLGPVLHEMAGIVQMTMQSAQTRPRLGASGLPIGEAIVRNLEIRRATPQTLETLGSGWEARRVRPRTWRVRLRFQHRGKRRVAEWEFRTDTRVARPRNKLASEIGWSAEGPGVSRPKLISALPPLVHPVSEGQPAQPDAEPPAVQPERADRVKKPARRAVRRPARQKKKAGSGRKATARASRKRKPGRGGGRASAARRKR